MEQEVSDQYRGWTLSRKGPKGGISKNVLRGSSQGAAETLEGFRHQSQEGLGQMGFPLWAFVHSIFSYSLMLPAAPGRAAQKQGKCGLAPPQVSCQGLEGPAPEEQQTEVGWGGRNPTKRWPLPLAAVHCESTLHTMD